MSFMTKARLLIGSWLKYHSQFESGEHSFGYVTLFGLGPCPAVKIKGEVYTVPDGRLKGERNSIVWNGQEWVKFI